MELKIDKELEIYNIKNLQCVSTYSLFNSKKESITGLLITYDGLGSLKTLTYTSDEKEFKMFFEKVRSTYRKERLERDNFNKIQIDGDTLLFLESNIYNESLEKLKEEIGECGVNGKRIDYKIKEVELYFDIFKSMLEVFFKLLNRNVQILDLKGFSNYFVLICKENNLEVKLPFTIIETSDILKKFVFPGIIDNKKELYFDINFGDKIVISLYDRSLKLKVVSEFHFSSEYSSFIKTVYVNGNVVDYSEEELESNTTKIGTSFSLIGNMSRSIKTDKVSDENCEKISFVISDFVLSRDLMHARQSEIKRERLDVENHKHFKNKLSITIFEEKRITDFYFINGEENYIVKETTFIPCVLSSGIYKSDLAGKTFYKIYKVSGKNLEDFGLLESVDVTIDDSIKGYQLFNESEIRKLLKKGNK